MAKVVLSFTPEINLSNLTEEELSKIRKPIFDLIYVLNSCQPLDDIQVVELRIDQTDYRGNWKLDAD